MLKIGTILGNRYEILEKIGAGGMSIVYRARDTKLERPVTVKVLRDEFISDEDFVSRFKIEAQAAASLSHPNIVNVYDVGTEYDTYYIVMEYINGCTLKEIINKEAPFDNKKALNYALKIASALQHAHRNHIVHRDIKPQNILVTVDGELKVTDFGIAHAANSSTVTMTSTAIGSVHYFSPEQARGGYVDEKSDLYSLGIVMYEMVTGKLPFEGDSSVSIALKHLNEDLPSIYHFNPNISKSLEGIILKATQKRADQRYLDVDSMIADMKKALNDPSGDFIKNQDLTFSTTQELGPDDIIAIRTAKKPPLKENIDIANDIDDIGIGSKDIEEKSTISDDINVDIDDKPPDDINKLEEIKIIVSAIATAAAIIAIIFTVVFITLKGRSQDNVSAQLSIEIPNLADRTLEEAANILTENTLILSDNYDEIENDTYEKGKIIDQIPPAGTKVKKGTEVSVTISKGIEEYKIPNLVGKSNIEAAEIIENDKHFILGNLGTEYNDDTDFGLICRQIPEAGEVAKMGTEIKAYISKGPAPNETTMPDIKGKPETRAKTLLKNAGLVGEPSYQASDTVDKGMVISQSVASGTTLYEGDSVVFIVSSGSKEKDMKSTTEATTKREIQTTTQATTERETETEEESTVQTIKNNTSSTDEATTELTTEATTAAPTKTKTIVVPAPSVDPGVDKVEVKVIKITQDGNSIVLSEEKSISDFPFSVQVKGNTNDIVQVYINGNLNADSKID